MHYSLQYRTGRNLTRIFPKIVPKFVLQNLPNLWIELGGKQKWLPLNFGYNDVMRTAPILLEIRILDSDHRELVKEIEWCFSLGISPTFVSSNSLWLKCKLLGPFTYYWKEWIEPFIIERINWILSIFQMTLPGQWGLFTKWPQPWGFPYRERTAGQLLHSA